jgi:hypothetical protein
MKRGAAAAIKRGVAAAIKRGVAAARRRATTAAQGTDLSEIENGIQGLVHVVAAGFDIRDFDENSAVNSNLHVVLRDRVLLWDLRGAAQIKTKTPGGVRGARASTAPWSSRRPLT